MLSQRIFKLIFVLSCIASFVNAQNQSIDKTRFTLLIDEAHQRQLPASAKYSKSFAAGNFAVIPANLRTLIPVNEFDLQGKKISFIPVPSGGYTVQVSAGEVSDQRGSKLRDVQVNFSSGFRFPFYGKKYSSVYIRRCGDLTFEQSSESCTDLVGVSSEVPRIIGTNFSATYNCPSTT